MWKSGKSKFYNWQRGIGKTDRMERLEAFHKVLAIANFFQLLFFVFELFASLGAIHDIILQQLAFVFFQPCLKGIKGKIELIIKKMKQQ